MWSLPSGTQTLHLVAVPLSLILQGVVQLSITLSEETEDHIQVTLTGNATLQASVTVEGSKSLQDFEPAYLLHGTSFYFIRRFS